MARRQKYLYVGVDLHKNHHVAVLVNHWGDRITQIQFENKPSAFPALLEEIFKHKKKPLKLAFGLEDVGGYGRSLALFLLENKQIVKEVNSALSHAQRMSYPTTQKDDYWDAFCCALVLLQRMDELPDANPQDIYFNIGQLVGRRKALGNAGIAIKNQLHQQLSYHYPSYRKFFSEVDGKTALNFFEEYPSPSKLKGIDVEKLGDKLKEWSNHFLGINKAKEIVELVEKDGDTTREFQEHRDFLIKSIVKELRYKNEETNLIDKQLEALLKHLDYKLTTIQGVDTATAAGIIAEIGDISRFKSSDSLARFAGCAPVSFSSGSSAKVSISKQGNRALNSVLYMLAMRQIVVTKDTQTPYNEYYYQYYQKKLKEGKTKASAIVCIQRKLVNLIFAMMKNKTEYIKPTSKVTIEQ